MESILVLRFFLGSKFNPDEAFTMASLTQLEKLSGIPVLASLEMKGREFQSVIRVKQHSVSGAIDKWLTAPVLSDILPTWKNLFLVLRLIDLDVLALQMETFLKEHPSLEKAEGTGHCFLPMVYIRMVDHYSLKVPCDKTEDDSGI